MLGLFLLVSRRVDARTLSLSYLGEWMLALCLLVGQWMLGLCLLVSRRVDARTLSLS